MRLNSGLGAVLFLALVLPVLSVSVFNYTKTERNLTEQTLLRRQTISRLAAIALQERLDRLKDIAKALATRVQFRKKIERGEWQGAVEIMKDAPKDFPMISRILVTDPSGILRADTPALPSVRGRSFKDRDWFQGVSQDWQVYISDIYERRAEPRYTVLAVAAPVRDERDDPIGILVLQVRVDQAFEWVRTIDVGPDGYVYFVDRAGNLAGHPSATGQGGVLNYASVPLVQEVLGGRRGIEIGFSPIEKEEQVAAYEPVPEYGWGVITQQPVATAFALQNKSLRNLLLVYSIIVIFAGITAYLVLRLIFQLKSSQSEIRKTRVFVESVLEHIPDTIIVKESRDLRFVRVNRSGEVVLGLSRNELIGKTDYDIFHKSEADFIVSRDRAVLESGASLDIPEERVHVAGKGSRIFHTKKVPIYDPTGKAEYLLGISEDITEKKEAEENRILLIREKTALAEAEKNVSLRDDFISIASHELRTPLSALKMQLQIVPKLLKDVPFDQKDRFLALLERALRQLDQFTRLVDELLDVSRIGAGSLKLNLEETDLSEVVRVAVERLQEELEEAGCSTELRGAESVKGVWDPVRIEQVVMNLIGNAMKYGAGKPIEITTWTEAKTARVAVKDHGIGISEEHRNRIFERYARVTPITKYRGLGLGLYISKQIVSAHGGSIRVESEGLGHGSTFVLELPLGEKEVSERGLGPG